MVLRKYVVVSEMLTRTEWVEYPVAGYEECYHIYNVVEAESHAKAKWKVWKNSDDYKKYGGYDIRDMPKFSIKLYKEEFND